MMWVGGELLVALSCCSSTSSYPLAVGVGESVALSAFFGVRDLSRALYGVASESGGL